MSVIVASPQELSFIYTLDYCVIAAFVLLVYDWLLSLSQEVRFIWTWRSRGITIASLVYAFNRYAWLLQSLLSVITVYPMSDLSCTANVWTQTTSGTIGLVAISTFSGLRAYALSNKSIWLAAIIILLGLPPVVMRIVEQVHTAPENLPIPLNCGVSSSLSPMLSISVSLIIRVTQLAAELLVVGITWWYTYQSYRIRNGVKLGRTISSLLFYNGSMYFLFLATFYILDIIFGMTSVPVAVQNVAPFLEAFIDPMSSILTCHFMLSLREFDSTIASATYSGMGSWVQDHVASAVLEFGAQPSDTLPAFIASFAHPVHVDMALSETDANALVEDGSDDEWREMDVMAPTSGTSSSQTPAHDQTSSSEPCM